MLHPNQTGSGPHQTAQGMISDKLSFKRKDKFVIIINALYTTQWRGYCTQTNFVTIFVFFSKIATYWWQIRYVSYSHEHLTNRWISKRYPQSVIAKRGEESSTCRAIFQWRQKDDLQLTNQRKLSGTSSVILNMLSSANKKRSIKSMNWKTLAFYRSFQRFHRLQLRR